MRKMIGLALLVLFQSACSESGAVPSPAEADGDDVEPASLLLTTTSTSPSTSTTTPTELLTPAAEPTQPAFGWAVTAVDESNQKELAATWRPACPVALEDLRLVELSHWNYEGESVTGRLVIRHDRVDAVVGVFERLHSGGFPIERMMLIEAYAGDDHASMTDNNTSAFNCREIDLAPGVWSQHAYGGAIDINPLVNPWVQASRVDPPEGAVYADRDHDVPGLIRAGDLVTQAFADAGWGWGGDWSQSKDYQHFSWNGL